MSAFIIRCDASATIGLGHFMRCLSLAGALRRQGGAVVFACRSLLPIAEQALNAAGIESRHLAADNADLCTEVPALHDLAAATGAGVVVLDHYAATPAYRELLRRDGLRLAVLDDLARQDLGSADLVLNQNLGAESLPYRTGAHTLRLFGPSYALLRPQFAERRQSLVRSFTGADRRLVITLGGSDVLGLYQRLLDALHRTDLRPLEIRLLVGGRAEPEALARLASTSRHRVEVRHNAANMAEHLAWADLALNAGGSTCWEMCCLGVPMLLVVLSEDQEPVARGLVERSCARRLDLAELAVPRQVEELLGDTRRRAEMSGNGMALVDGLGAQRVAEALLSLLGRRAQAA